MSSKDVERPSAGGSDYRKKQLKGYQELARQQAMLGRNGSDRRERISVRKGSGLGSKLNMRNKYGRGRNL